MIIQDPKDWKQYLQKIQKIKVYHSSASLEWFLHAALLGV